jgi:prolyl 4-hydroxylase
MTTAADYKVRIGIEVGARLQANPDAVKIPSYDLDIFVVRAFLDDSDCARLIEMIDANRVPSQLLRQTGDKEFRTSESCNMEPGDPFVRSIEDKLTALTGIEPSHGETLQGQRYAVGQRFKPHHDFFHDDQAYWPEMERTGGQRTWTAMVFLNEPEGGGETDFAKAGIRVTPQTGNLLIWNNMNVIGVPNAFSIHEGCPVTAGTKYIFTKWYRERPWLATTTATPY